MEQKASDTALGVAVLRAVHQLMDGEPKILNDPIIVRMLDAATRTRIQEHTEVYQVPHRRALRTNVLIRSRFAEDHLAEAVRRGVKQYVILGAGMDTFAYRQPEWADRLQIFELDHPASQNAKRAKLKAAQIPIPANLEYIQADFEKDSLRSVLEQSSFNFSESAFFSCLGVLMYLTDKTVDTLLRFVASMLHESEIVFSFANEDQSSIIERNAEALGEPWLTKFQPDMLEQKLRNLGFSHIQFLTPERMAELYIHGRQDGLVVPRRASIVSAKV